MPRLPSYERSRCLAISLGLFLVTILVYLRAQYHPFLFFDDRDYLENFHVRSGASFSNALWFFIHVHFSNWHPLTSILYMLERQVFGLNPRPFHLVNILIHALNSVLVFVLLNRMTQALWPSAFVAALFALHPAHVESVAWVAELKDVLSTFFFLLTILSYAHYVSRPNVARYLLCLAMFVLALLSKPMVVTLPFVLLLLDFWPLERLNVARSALAGRIRFVIVEKIPFLVLSGGSSVLTFIAQRQGGAIVSMTHLPIGSRVQTALGAYVLYLGKTFWPKNLAALYPYAQFRPSDAVAAAMLLLLITTGTVLLARHRKYLLVGWLWYLGTLVPVIGLVQVGSQSMADRYTYIPLIGIFIMTAWGIAEVAPRLRLSAPALTMIACVLLLACAIRTWFQISYWREDEVLFAHAVDVTTDNSFALYNLADSRYRKGKYEASIEAYRAALRIKPDLAEAHLSIGLCLAAQKKYPRAIAEFDEAIRMVPEYGEAHASIASADLMLGNVDGALVHAREAVRISPKEAKSHYTLALVLIREEDLKQAADALRESLRLAPSAEAHAALADVLLRQADVPGAESNAREAIKLNDACAPAHGNLGLVLLRQRKWDQASEEFRRAASLDPNDAESRYQLAAVLIRTGKIDQAVMIAHELAKLSPADPRAFLQLGLIAQMQHDIPRAIDQYRMAIRLDAQSAARNNLAWILATSPDSRSRDGAQAVKLAEELNREQSTQRAETLDTLAAAYAASADFERAKSTAQRAIDAANSTGNASLAAEITNRLDLYKRGMPYRDSSLAAEK